MKVNSGKDVAEEYRSSLADLTINSKPLINMLTMLAEDYIEHAPVIVKVVELHLQKVASDIKLPVLYLIDSIVKNVGKTYIHLFTQNIVSTFCAVFEKVDEKVRSQMFKLRQTWIDVFPAKKLFALDVRVHSIDPAWPITAAGPPQAVRIHVNPKFLQGHTTQSPPAPSTSSSDSSQQISGGMMREELLKQQKELLELQKRKVELELLQTKAILEEQQKKLENQAAGFITETALSVSQPDSTGSQQQQAEPDSIQYSSSSQAHCSSNVPTNTSSKTYKSPGSTFRTRDPRIKYNKDKGSEARHKNNPSLKVASQNAKQEGRQSKREKKNYKRHKERHNATASTSAATVNVRIQSDNDWSKNISSSEAREPSAFPKKRLGRYDRELHTKFSSEEPPPPGVDVITYSDSTDFAEDVEVKKSRNKTNRFYASPSVSSSSEVNIMSDTASVSASNDLTSTTTVTENGTETQEVSESQVADVSTAAPSGTGGIKRSHSRSPSPSVPESTEDSGVPSSSDLAEPPKKILSTVETRFSPSQCEVSDDIVGTNATKDVDLRLLPSPTKGLSDDPHSNNVPSKLSRAEMMDTLFGEEDVDLRTLPSLVRSSRESSPITSNQHAPLEELTILSSNSPVRESKSPCSTVHTTESAENHPPDSPLPSVPRSTSPRPLSPFKASPIARSVSPASVNSPAATINPSKTIVSSTATPGGDPNTAFNSSAISVAPPYIPPVVSTNNESTSKIDMMKMSQLHPPPQFSPEGSPVRTSPSPELPSTMAPNMAFSSSSSMKLKPPFGINPLGDAKYSLSLPSSLPGLPSCPSPPSPPPPPIISKDDTAEESSWANYKRTKCEEGSNRTPENTRRNSSNKKERTPSSIFRSNGVIEDKESDQESEERSSENCNLIIKEAEHQLSNGNITFSQYNRMLKEVIAINEERKLQEALRKDESYGQEDSETEAVDVDQASSSSEEKEDRDHQSSSDSEFPNQEAASSLPSETDTISSGISNKHKDEEYRPKSRKRPYYSTEGPNRFVNPGRGRPQKQMWDIRNIPPNHNTLVKGGTRSKWYTTRGPLPLQMQPLAPNAQLTPRCNAANFPVWMTPTVPGPSQPVCGPAPVYYESTNPPATYRFGPPIPLKKPYIPHHIAHRRQDLPPADPLVLELIEKDCVRLIKIDGVIREVSYYGETAIVMVGWDDPREVTFQAGSRVLIVDDHDQFLLHFNSPYRDCIIDDHIFEIRLGAPTREVFIDGLYYEVIFGGPPIQIMLAGRLRKFRLTGPMPNVRIGEVSRTDLVAGKINLIVDAKNMFPIYLDAKPQRFEVGGVPYILRFVEALQTVVINGVPFKFEYGGVPVPIFFHGEKHFLRLSVLPRDIKPGYVTIFNMEGGRLPSPAPDMNVPSISHHPCPPSHTGSQYKQNMKAYGSVGNDQPLELLTSLMPTTTAPSAVPSYSVEHNPRSSSATSPPPSSVGQPFGNINVGELFQKLVASGIVPPVAQNENTAADDSAAIKLVDFTKPETLKVKQPGLISRLYSGIQCSSCGVRFSPEQTVKYSQHLDWHFRQNRREKMSARVARSRRWNYDVSDWIQFQEIEDQDDRVASWFEMQEKNKSKDSQKDPLDEPSVAAIVGGQEEEFCQVCHDELDLFYNEEKEEWHWRKAVRVDGLLYHPLCHQEVLENRARVDPPEMPNFEEEEPIIIDDGEPNISNTDLEKDTKNDVLEEIDKFEDDNDLVEVNKLEEKSEEINKLENFELVKENESTVDKNLLPEDENTSHMSDDGDVEIVAVSSEPILPECTDVDNSKDTDMDVSNVLDHESDDDILQIEVVEPKIESYEIIDDEEDDNESGRDNVVCSTEQPAREEEIMYCDEEEGEEELVDFSRIKVKKEKLDLALPDPVTIPSHVTVVSTIDGNVELDEATPVVLPRNKIKINISSKHMPQFSRATPTDTPIAETVMEPPPPGEELVPATLKPKLVGNKMENREPVTKGSEISGLCSIM